jgi:predicted kinase
MKITKKQLTNIIHSVMQEQTIAQEYAPKAIFLAGGAGSGKSSVIKQHLPKDFKVINSDEEYEKLMLDAGITLRQIDLTPEELSTASKMQAQSRILTAQKLKKYLDDRENIIIDGTAASIKNVEKQKKELEDIGYKTFMIVLYISPLKALKRNLERGKNNRGRTLKPSIIVKTWYDVTKNIEEYKSRVFRDAFSLITTQSKAESEDFSRELIEPFYAVDKTRLSVKNQKTPEQIEKEKEKKHQMYDAIKQIVKNPPKLDTIDVFKNKLNNFLNS